ncbi:MAG: LysR family transcriptional regulator [Lautropia sp.]
MPAPSSEETPINLRQLRYFIRIVETGNMTRAAEQLFVAQPALGAQVRQLEAALGVSLLSRHSRGVSPTPAGRILYQRACEIVRLVDETERQVAAAGRPQRERIRLGLTNGLINLLSRDLTLRARQSLPDVDLQLIEEMSSELADAVERNELDLALAYEIAQRQGLLRVPLIEEELLFISAAGAGDVPDTIAFSELASRPLALPVRHDGTHQLIRSAAVRMGLELNVALEVSSVTATRDLVAHGDVDSVMPFASAVQELRQGRLIARRIVNPALRRTLYLLRSERRALFVHEDALVDLLGTMVIGFVEQLDPLAVPLDGLRGRLSVIAARHAKRPTG